MMKSILGWQGWGKIWGYLMPLAQPTPTVTNIKYGYLYNWYAATEVKQICSNGWHVPTKSEINILLLYLDGHSTISNTYGYTNTGAESIFEKGIFWNSENIDATNLFKFNNRGNGIRYTNGQFGEKGASSYCICSDVQTVAPFIGSLFFYSQFDAQAYQLYWSDGYEKALGAGIRLIKDSTTLSHGQSGTYVGNDGKVYRTICIGSQEWLADNLAETKYRNGDLIPTVTDNTEWIGLTTGAKCAYNNDENNVLL